MQPLFMSKQSQLPARPSRAAIRFEVAGITRSPPPEVTRMMRSRSVARRSAARSASARARQPSAAGDSSGAAKRRDTIPVLRTIAAGLRGGVTRCATSAVETAVPHSIVAVPAMRTGRMGGAIVIVGAPARSGSSTPCPAPRLLP